MLVVGPAALVSDLLPRLEALNACLEALAWLRSLPAGTTAQEAWALCEQGDWMLWLADVMAGWEGSEARRKLTFAAAAYIDYTASVANIDFASNMPAPHAGTDMDYAKTLRRCADRVRRYYPHPPKIDELAISK